MKVFYLTAIFCCIGNALFAQTIPAPTSKYKDFFLKQTTTPVDNKIISTPGSKVYVLPLDKMPCFVPDVNLIAAIPNAAPAPVHSNMPNALKVEPINSPLRP